MTMTTKFQLRMTASELAMGRFMRAPDHSAADEFSQAFEDLSKEDATAAGAAEKGGGDGTGGTGGAGEPAPAAESGGAAGGGGDGAGASEAGAAAPAADDTGSAPAATDDAPGAAADDKGGKGAGAGKEPAAAGADDAAAAAAAAADDKGGKGGKGKAPAPAPAAGAAPAGESDDDVLKRLAKAVKKVDTEDSAAAPAAAEEPQEQPLFTAEEQGKIDHFRKEWPEVAEAFDLQARALANSVLKYAFKEIGAVVNPLRETVDVLATRTHYGDLKEKGADYTDAEREAIVAWVNEQPTYLQTGMMSVIEGGTAEEVADLVGRYRAATGTAPAGAGAGEQGGAQGGEQELSGAAKQAAAALAPVGSKRSAVATQDDPSDFDGNFAKFAESL
jgi:hypothetical protein